MKQMKEMTELNRRPYATAIDIYDIVAAADLELGAPARAFFATYTERLRGRRVSRNAGAKLWAAMRERDRNNVADLAHATYQRGAELQANTGTYDLGLLYRILAHAMTRDVDALDDATHRAQREGRAAKRIAA